MKQTSDSDSDSDSDEDQLMARVAALPPPMLDPRSHARVQQSARAAWLAAGPAARAGHRASVDAGARWTRLWNRLLEPVIVAGIIAGYFAWTATALGAIDRGSDDAAGGAATGPAVQLRAR
jgi:hypothetical protein